MSRKTRAANPPATPAQRAEKILLASHKLHEGGNPQGAIEGYHKVLALLPAPQDPQGRAVRGDALHLMGLIEITRGRFGTAMDLIGEAINVNPAAHIYYTHLGTVFFRLGLFDKAEEACRRSVVMNPGFAFSHYNFGNVLSKTGKTEEARAEYLKSLALNPNDSETITSIGTTYHAQSDFDSAIQWYRRAVEVAPGNHQAIYNIGVALHDQARYEDALPYYERALVVKPGYVLPLWNRGLTRLTLGNLREGWDDFEARWQFEEQMREVSIPAKRFRRPMWRGEKGAPLRIHLHGEQGVGDTLQFCRYAEMVRAMGHDVRLEVPPPLLDLLRRSLTREGISVQSMAPDYPGGMGILEFDYHCPMMSLPRAFGTEVATIPWNGPYLKPDPGKVAKWQARLAGYQGRKIGLCWAGGKRTHDPLLAAVDGRRSVSVDTLKPIWSRPGNTYVSLQVGANAVGEGHTILDWTKEIDSFDDTAALIEALDLVISVDTSVIHVAGGLGKPIWMLNRYDTCWRWLRSGSETKWYPSMKIIRQPRAKDWRSVVEEVVRMLGETTVGVAA